MLAAAPWRIATTDRVVGVLTDRDAALAVATRDRKASADGLTATLPPHATEVWRLDP